MSFSSLVSFNTNFKNKSPIGFASEQEDLRLYGSIVLIPIKLKNANFLMMVACGCKYISISQINVSD
jgi:hypothetical protein|tara:strand:- start:208 stop:408 length:201 start_codon:yes stop_codon:yes gene_type:complete